jgi:hypothetical protein
MTNHRDVIYNDYSGFGYGGYDRGYICMVPDTDNSRKTDINYANVEVWASAGVWMARSCYADWNGANGGCGMYSETSGNGHRTIGLGSGSGFWDDSDDFGFVFVAASPDEMGRFAGVFYAN